MFIIDSSISIITFDDIPDFDELVYIKIELSYTVKLYRNNIDIIFLFLQYYTVVRNVKKAHQIQEIGEFQEFNDDVEYLLDALQVCEHSNYFYQSYCQSL